MNRVTVHEQENNTSNPSRTSSLKSNQFQKKSSLCFSLYSPKLWFYILIIFVTILILFQIHSLKNTSTSSSWIHQWQEIIKNSTLSTFHECGQDLAKSMALKLRQAVTFLPLKDLRYANAALKGHTWFMSSLYDMHDEGEVQYQQFPTQGSSGRILCLKGYETHDGSWNSYALAWPDALPRNATLLNGITFVSYNHYDYHNIWHGLSAMMPFVAWHIKSQCAVPKRWILYHWGEIRSNMAPWVQTLLEATFGEPLHIERFEGPINRSFDPDDHDTNPSCFEEAVVMRHNEGGMSKDKRMETYDLMRCKARMYCNVSSEGRHANGVKIGMTMLMREGTRSFRNGSTVIGIFEKECRKVEGCQLMVAYPHNLTFCQQVELMSKTDILISAHGAQLSNMILMDRNSSVMEFFPRGWLELAGVGQYVHHWLANWSGMKHQGAWRDPVGDYCPYKEDDRRCMSMFKNGRIGHNETYFSEWARDVLDFEVKIRNAQLQEQGLVKKGTIVSPVAGLCDCG